MERERTTIAIQRYLNDLGEISGSSPAEPIIRNLLACAASRLQLLCTTLLHRSYPRLTRPPLNLQSEEMLSAVVERMLKALRSVHPENVRQFFALANQHMRWELNDLARRLDQQTAALGLRDELVRAPESSGSVLTPDALRILAAIDELPADEREVFDLVRIQGMTQSEVATLLDVSTKTVQRRLNRGLFLLAQKLADLQPQVQQ